MCEERRVLSMRDEEGFGARETKLTTAQHAVVSETRVASMRISV